VKIGQVYPEIICLKDLFFLNEAGARRRPS